MQSPPLHGRRRGDGGRMMRVAIRRVGLGLSVAALLGLSVGATPAAAFGYPGGFTTSWYMDTVSQATLYDMGCALGTARSGGSEPQDALVILDFSMPVMDGAQCLARLRELRPDVKVLLTSGHGNLEDSLDPSLLAGCLQKPYRIHELIDAVKGILEGRG